MALFIFLDKKNGGFLAGERCGKVARSSGYDDRARERLSQIAGRAVCNDYAR